MYTPHDKFLTDDASDDSCLMQVFPSSDVEMKQIVKKIKEIIVSLVAPFDAEINQDRAELLRAWLIYCEGKDYSEALINFSNQLKVLLEEHQVAGDYRFIIKEVRKSQPVLRVFALKNNDDQLQAFLKKYPAIYELFKRELLREDSVLIEADKSYKTYLEAISLGRSGKIMHNYPMSMQNIDRINAEFSSLKQAVQTKDTVPSAERHFKVTLCSSQALFATTHELYKRTTERLQLTESNTVSIASLKSEMNITQNLLEQCEALIAEIRVQLNIPEKQWNFGDYQHLKELKQKLEKQLNAFKRSGLNDHEPNKYNELIKKILLKHDLIEKWNTIVTDIQKQLNLPKEQWNLGYFLHLEELKQQLQQRLKYLQYYNLDDGTFTTEYQRYIGLMTHSLEKGKAIKKWNTSVARIQSLVDVSDQYQDSEYFVRLDELKQELQEQLTAIKNLGLDDGLFESEYQKYEQLIEQIVLEDRRLWSWYF